MLFLVFLINLFTFSLAAQLPAIEIVGNKFFYSNNGSQFFMKGIAYQQNNLNSTAAFVDPLANPVTCKRDVPYLQQLNTNTIRVYALNASQDHSECMQLLNDAGIYVIADLSEPDLSINRDSPEWNLELFNRYTSIIDEFSNYTNILGFFAGNEVTNNKSNTDASAFVKAAIRDSKAYIAQKKYRSIPVGYSSNDDTDIRGPLADYFVCDVDGGNADFFGINMYSWCGNSTFQESGYDIISNLYQNLGVPLFFSEYGCNEVQPRIFQEVGTLYSDKMTNLWSGGIVYMYFQETNNYGLVTIQANGAVKTLEDFNYYSSEIHAVSPSSAQASAQSSTTPTSCPAQNATWRASTVLPPVPDSMMCECMNNAAECVVSSKVDSSEYADLFSIVCGYVDCSGISGNGTSGEYGAFSPCSNEERLNFVLNLYYQSRGKSSTACNFSGSATLKSATTASSCAGVLSSAGASGLGTLSGSIRTNGAGTDATTKSNGSGSGSSKPSSSSTSSKGAAANYNVDPNVKYGAFGLVFAFVSGLLML